MNKLRFIKDVDKLKQYDNLYTIFNNGYECLGLYCDKDDAEKAIVRFVNEQWGENFNTYDEILNNRLDNLRIIKLTL